MKYLSFKCYTILWLLLAMLAFNKVFAESLVIDITGGVESSTPIAIAPFVWNGISKQSPINLSSIIKADLSFSGYFDLLPEQDMLPSSENSKIKFSDWQDLGQEYLVVGEITPNQKKYIVQFKLFNILKGERIVTYKISAQASDLRQAAHRISDLIFAKLIGIPGAFNSKIAYIVNQHRQRFYTLQVADADGFNPRIIVESKEPLMSLAWSPDASKIAYASYEKKSPSIFIQTIATGKREKISSYSGINSAPAWSPDGKNIAMALSKDGNPDIYVLNLSSRKLKKLTKSYGVDTGPEWSPDGKFIVFTSDRAGTAQLYQVPSNGGSVQRLTFQGDYNAQGKFSKNGKKLAMTHGNNGDLRIAVMDMATKNIAVLTAGKQDESPSFSPNGDMLIYATIRNNMRFLSVVSIDGRILGELMLGSGEVDKPAWSPY